LTSVAEIEILGSHMATITRLLEERKHIAGDICEFGVYAGATTVQLAQLNRFVWAFDTFQGIPAEDFIEGLDVDHPGKFAPQPEIFELLGQYKNIMPVVGRFEETLPDIRQEKVVLAYLDCDLYLSAMTALAWLGNHLVAGGVIVLDDYSTHPGIQKAVKEFMNPGFMLPPFNKLGLIPSFDGSEVIYWGLP
jgi:hypothetical protein